MNNLDTAQTIEQTTPVVNNLAEPTVGSSEKPQITPSGNEQQVSKPIERQFTQSQVNEIMRERIKRTQGSLLNRYGVQSRDELDGMIGKAQSYQIIKEKYEEQGYQLTELNRKLAFVNNNINPKREGDIMAYFKGKELEFSEETLTQELITHPEWLNVVQNDNSPKTTIKALGIDRQVGNTPETEDARIKRIFGV